MSEPLAQPAQAQYEIVDGRIRIGGQPFPEEIEAEKKKQLSQLASEGHFVAGIHEPPLAPMAYPGWPDVVILPQTFNHPLHGAEFIEPEVIHEMLANVRKAILTAQPFCKLDGMDIGNIDFIIARTVATCQNLLIDQLDDIHRSEFLRSEVGSRYALNRKRSV